MRDLEKVASAILTLVQLGGIAGITAIGLKRNNDAYKAECKWINAKFELVRKDCEIDKLKRDMAYLKKKYNIKDEDLD